MLRSPPLRSVGNNNFPNWIGLLSPLSPRREWPGACKEETGGGRGVGGEGGSVGFAPLTPSPSPPGHECIRHAPVLQAGGRGEPVADKSGSYSSQRFLTRLWPE